VTKSKFSSPFNFAAKRRREIVLHARHINVMDSDDRPHLMAWHWFNRDAKDPIWSLMEAAKRMGGEISEAEAAEIIREASATRRQLSADNMARFLGVTWDERQALGLTTIGSVDVKKSQRRERRRERNRKAHEQRRRAAGIRPRTQYESQSLSALQPWKEQGMSRAAWYRSRNKRGTETSLSAPILLSSEDRPVSPAQAQAETERGFAPKASKPPSQAAIKIAVDAYGSLPMELRLLALGLPLGPENLAKAA
jgi:hypothetical protein